MFCFLIQLTATFEPLQTFSICKAVKLNLNNVIWREKNVFLSSFFRFKIRLFYFLLILKQIIFEKSGFLGFNAKTPPPHLSQFLV